MAGQQCCYFQVTIQERGRSSRIDGQLIQCTGYRRLFRLIVRIQPYHCIFYRVITIRYLLGKRPLIQPHDGTTQCQLFVHIIVQSHRHKVLLLKTERGIVLILHIDRYTGIKYTRIDDLQLAQSVVYRIVLVLYKFGTTRRHSYRARRYIKAT